MHPLIIWLILASLEALRHVYLIKHNKTSPDKSISLTVRCLIATGLGLWEVIELEKFWLQMFLTYLSTGWWIHNTVIALSLGRKPWYLNDNGWMDSKLKPFSIPFWGMLTIAAWTLTWIYFIKDPIWWD